MENDDYREPPLVYESQVHLAATAYSQAEAELFGAIGRCVNNPLRKQHTVVFNRRSEEAQRAFCDLVLAIAEDDELEPDERASSITTVYCQAQDKRLDYFRKLSPTAEYDEGETTPREVAENIQDLFRSGKEPEDIALALAYNYMCSFEVDLEELLDTAEPGKLARAIVFAQDAGEHALEVGKMSAAIAIGGVVAHKIIKRLGG